MKFPQAEEVGPNSGYELHRKGKRSPPTTNGPSGSLTSATSVEDYSHQEVIFNHASESEALG